MKNKNESNAEPEIHSECVGREEPVPTTAAHQKTDPTQQSAVRNLKSNTPQTEIYKPKSNTQNSSEILIVEDSSVEAEMLRRTLVTAGYVVRIARNGEEGLQAAIENHPALVLSDINMPVLNGFQLCRAIKYDETMWNIPLILLTVLSEPKDIIEALHSGADGYIIKPYIEAILLERVRSLLEAPVERPRMEERRKEVVIYGGKRHDIAAGGQQVINLLLSLYENMLDQNRELESAKNQINLMIESLDRQVQERTDAVRQSEERYKRITEGLTDYLYTVRIENGRAIESIQSPACVAVTGYEPEEFAADPYLWIKMVVPEDREMVNEHVRQILSGENTPPVEHRITRKDGTVRWISDTAILNRDAAGKLISYDGLIKDITERKHKEAILRKQLEELRRWQDSTLGREGRILELKGQVNELLEQMGQSPRYPSAQSQEPERDRP